MLLVSLVIYRLPGCPWVTDKPRTRTIRKRAIQLQFELIIELLFVAVKTLKPSTALHMGRSDARFTQVALEKVSEQSDCQTKGQL